MPKAKAFPQRRQLGFPLETLQALFIIRELLRQHFHRNVTVELRVASAEDLTHPAFADGLEDLVVGEAPSGGK